MYSHRFVTDLGTDVVYPLLNLFGEKLGRPSFVIVLEGIFKVIFTDDQYLMAFFSRESLVCHLGDNVALTAVSPAGYGTELARHGVEDEVLHGAALVHPFLADGLSEVVKFLRVVHGIRFYCVMVHQLWWFR